jgi:hypothetical protein
LGINLGNIKQLTDIYFLRALRALRGNSAFKNELQFHHEEHEEHEDRTWKKLSDDLIIVH